MLQKFKTNNQGASRPTVSKELLIFVVDDEEFYQSMIEQNLLKFQKFFSNQNFDIEFTIKKFDNGADCIVSLIEKPDIIFLDYYLKINDNTAVNGDYIYKNIIEINPKQKVVFVSGQQDSKVVYGLIQMGVRDYIYKDESMYACIEDVMNDLLNKIV